jgi:hypothetical protein
MIRFLIWLAGCAAFFYAVERMGLWREAIAIAVLLSAICWFVGGGLWAFAGARHRARRGSTLPADDVAIREAFARAIEECRKREAVK